MKDDQTTETPGAIPLPEGVRLAMDDTAGLGVMSVVVADRIAGPKGTHQPGRRAVRHGSEAGSVTLGGRRVPVRRPRVRATDGSGELPVPADELFSGTDLLGQMAVERMRAKLSCRRDQAGLEPVGAEVTARARSTSKSAVSRRFVTATECALGELLARDLSGLDLVALMVDGVHFGDHLCVVALGIGIDGTKHPLAVVEGVTENTTTVTDLLVGLRDRGLDTTRPVLVVIDGAKALRSAVETVFDCPVVRRCQLHKIRNVQSKLPDRMAATVGTKMRAAEKLTSALEAEATLVELARQLDRSHPGAAGSLREGLAETLTVIRLGVPATLARTLRSTNAISVNRPERALRSLAA